MYARMLLAATLSLILVATAWAQAPPPANTAPASKAPAATEPAPAPGPPLASLTDRFSYAMGLDMGRTWKRQSLAINYEAIVRGIKDGLSGAKAALTEAEIAAVAEELNKQMAARRTQQVGENLAAGNAFLAANGKKPGVVTLPSGLQYKVLKAGTGQKPKATDTVKTHYTGRLIDGTVFDSSVDRNEPVSFPVGNVIPGWVEALQLMPVGSKWQLFIPAKLAYGERGTPGGEIPPNSTLVFEIELLNIE
ncbi:MAG: FKBP-type peptidyl-prolyl cis-trans isomerase [Pirellulales bacterium]